MSIWNDIVYGVRSDDFVSYLQLLVFLYERTNNLSQS